MLVVRCRNGEWIEFTHQSSGETIRVRLHKMRIQAGDRVIDCVCDDPARNFKVRRPGAKVRPKPANQVTA